MPDLEAQVIVPDPPSKQQTVTNINCLDSETESFKDTSDEPPIEFSAERASSPDLSLSESQLSLKKEFPEEDTGASTLMSSTPEIDHEKDIIEASNDLHLNKQRRSPPSPPLTSNGSVDQTNTNFNPLNPDSLNDNATQLSQEPDTSLASSSSISDPSKIQSLLPKITSSLSRPSNNLSSVPTSISQISVQPYNPPPPAVSTRKLTSPFSWLSRTTPKDPNASSPPTPSPYTQLRRNTASSIVTIGSNPETIPSKLEGGNESEGINGTRRPSSSSLKDRFKFLRMREEAGIASLPEDVEGKDGWPASRKNSALDHTSPKDINEKERQSPISPLSPFSNPSLAAAAMAAGVAPGPSIPVDWDLWQSVVDEGPVAFAKTSAEKLNHAITAGIPNAIRGVVWQILAQSKNEELETVYRDLVARGTDKDRLRNSSGFVSTSQSMNTPNGKEEVVTSSSSSVHSDQSTAAKSTVNGFTSHSPPKDPETNARVLAALLAEKKKKAKEDAASLQRLEKSIKRDLGARTSFSKFATSAGLQEGLFGVCKAYALFDEGVGYAQGMNFLVMPLLFNMPQDEAFCLLVKLMNQYNLRDLFIQDMPGLHMRLYQFERLLEDLEPALYCHLQRRQLVLRIYDLILSEGLGAIIKFGIVLLQKNTKTLLGMSDMVALTNFLKDRLFDVYIDATPSSESILESGFFGSSGNSIDKEIYRADQLVQDACAVKATPELLKTYTLEWEEKTRIEKEREAEIQNYRLNNQKLSLKVRQLEERVQDHDTEHAALATELVRTKVVNEELEDENESLKVQVKELRDLIEKLPDEIEEKLKTEMDRLLKRNQEVHNENNRLEEDISNMEKTLVKTKMQYAEIHAAHETLNRKWNDLRKALGN